MYSKSNLIACDLLIKLETEDYKTAYTTNPSGKVYIPKLFGKEDDFWEKQVPMESRANSVIVITDWSYKYAIAVVDWIYDLMDQDFEIYAWTGELVKIDSYYDLNKALHNIKPIHPSLLEAILSQHEIEKDSVKIIDYFKRRQIEAFLADGKVIEPTLNFCDIDKGLLNTEVESILNSLSSYLFFDILVSVGSIIDFDLLVKCAELPQFRGLNCLISSSTFKNNYLINFNNIRSKDIYDLRCYKSFENCFSYDEFLNDYKGLINIKEIDVNNTHSNVNELDFTSFPNQLKSICLDGVSYEKCKFSSFNSLQKLELKSFDCRLLHAICSTAPNIEILHLNKYSYDISLSQIKLLKLKKLHLENLRLDRVIKTLNFPFQLEELTLKNVYTYSKTVREFENLTQLNQLCIQDTRMPVEHFITLIKNNIYLEKIILNNVQFTSLDNKNNEQKIDLTELLQKNSHLLLSLRSIEVNDDKNIDFHALSSILLTNISSIENITLEIKKLDSHVEKCVIYQKNHQIFLKGDNIEPHLLNLFLNLFLSHSDYINSLSINCLWITVFLKSILLEHKDKLSKIKILKLPNFLGEEYLALCPTLKRIEFRDFSFLYGSLRMKNYTLDFQTFFQLEQHHTSDLTQLILEDNYNFLNEELILNHRSDFPFKLLSISSSISSTVITKLINHSPHLESLRLKFFPSRNLKCDTLSKSLEVLILEHQSAQTICNFLSHKPLLKRLELEIPTENDSLFKLLEQCIAASTQLNHLVLNGNISSTQSQRILDFIIKNNREMQTLILGKHFVFKKNEQLRVKIATKEDYLFGLLKSSPNLKILHINQPIPIKKLLGHSWKNLDYLMVVSCLDSQPGTESLSETFDLLLALCPAVSKSSSPNISVNFYRQNSFFIVAKMKNDKFKLHTTERLSNVQLANYITNIKLKAFEIQGINGLLLDDDPTSICSLNFDLKDSSSLLDNLDYFSKKNQFYDFSLCSPHVKITHSKVEWHGDKLNDEQISKILKLARNLDPIRIVTIHNQLSLTVIAALDRMEIKNINLVNVNQQDEFISQLVKKGVEITARNTSLQVLYQIKHPNKELTLTGVQFPPLLFNLLLEKEEDVYYSKLRLEDFSFSAPIKFSRKAPYDFNLLFLKNAKIDVSFILIWLLLTPTYKSFTAVLTNCPTINSNQLEKLKLQFPDFEFQVREDKSTPILTSQSLLTPNSCEQDEPLNLIDAKTGEQQAKTNFTKDSSIFREKKSKKLSPNYLRLRVQNDGVNVVKKIKDLSYRKYIIQLYEEFYKEHPDYYLAELRVSLKKDRWYSLPSITPEDNLFAFNASEQLELGYSKKKNLFYIRCAKSCEVNLAYMLHAVLDIRFSNEQMDKNYQAYFPCIQSINFEKNELASLFQTQFLTLQKMPLEFREELLIHFCRFEVGDLSNSSLTGKSLFNLLIRERKGVCRHNVSVFSELKSFFNQNLPSKLKIKARESFGIGHVIIEVKRNNKWQMICLGGAEMPEAINTEEEKVKPPQQLATKLMDFLQSNLQELGQLFSSPTLEVQENVSAKEEPPFVRPQIDLLEPTKIELPELKPPHEIKAELIGPTTAPQQALIKKDFSYVLSLNPFKPSKQAKTIPASNFLELAKQVMDLAKDLQPGENNLLLNFVSPAQVELFYATLASALSVKQNRFLLMHEPSQFKPSEFVIDSKTGEHSNQPTTLVKSVHHAKPGDFLIVNIANYADKTVALLNALTDRKKRVLANQPVSEALTIIAVKLNTTEVEEDVYSRFLNQEYFVPKLNHTNPFEPFRKPLNPSVSDEETLVIDFYDGASWRSQLLGSLELEGPQVHYKKGTLIQMIKAGKTSIRFYNPPMNLAEFRVALLNLVSTKHFDANGELYDLPAHFSFESAAKIYDLASSKYSYLLGKNSAQKEGAYVLNETTYHHFFNNFKCKNKTINHKTGWLLNHANQELAVWITGHLHEALWAKLLDSAIKHHCQLILFFESRLLMPPSMRKRAIEQEQLATEHGRHKNYIIVSNDAYLSEIQCQAKDEPQLMSFEVSENTQFSNLFESIHLRKNQNEKELAVDWHSSPVRENLLKEGQKVILKGCINQELADRLQSLFSTENFVYVNGKKEKYKGQLILILADNKFFKNAKVIQHKFNSNDVFKELWTHYPEALLNSWKWLLQTFIKKAQDAGIALNFNYLTIKSMLDFHQKYPQTNPFLPFILLHPKYKALKNLALSVYPIQEPMITSANEFDENRKQSVSQMLDFFSFGFLVGESGSGKTTFVNNTFKGKNVHFGLANLEKWAIEGGLFYLDETNLFPKGALNFFGGLFSSNPGLLINNKFYPIKIGLKHRILWGGNYSDFTNRQNHTFLQQVPVIEFENFPHWYLKERVLKKAIQLACSLDEATLEDIVSIQLKVYHYVNEHNPKAGWTVRNLENMALRFILFREERPTQSTKAQAWLSAFDELSNRNEPRWLSIFQNWVEAQYPLGEIRASLNKGVNHSSDSFIITECRQNVFRLMLDQVKIQKLKDKYPELGEFTAVGACLLEGETGLGKSITAAELAESLGYKKGDEVALAKENKADSNCYYFVSQDSDELLTVDSRAKSNSGLMLTPIEQRLTTLFHAGSKVIIDEINSFDHKLILVLEKILLALLSGVDLSMEQAKNPGFFVFLSQNPIHYKNRKKLALPLENRMFKLDFLDYSQKGLGQIAKHNGLHPLFAKATAAFFHQSSKRNQSTALSAPNFREYLDKVEAIRKDNPLSGWFFLETVYGYLGERDRQALYCTSLFCLSAFAFLHQPSLWDSPVEKPISSLINVEGFAEVLGSNEVEMESDSEEEAQSQSEEESLSEKEPENSEIVPSNLRHEEEPGKPTFCCSGLSMQILGGFITALGLTVVAVAIVGLNIASFGLPGIFLAILAGATVLIGTGVFTKGVVESYSDSNAPDCLTSCTF